MELDGCASVVVVVNISKASILSRVFVSRSFV